MKAAKSKAASTLNQKAEELHQTKPTQMALPTEEERW